MDARWHWHRFRAWRRGSTPIEVQRQDALISVFEVAKALASVTDSVSALRIGMARQIVLPAGLAVGYRDGRIEI